MKSIASVLLLAGAAMADTSPFDWAVFDFTGMAYVETNAILIEETQGFNNPKREPEEGYYLWYIPGSEMNGLTSTTVRSSGLVTSLGMWTAYADVGDAKDFRADVSTMYSGSVELNAGAYVQGTSKCTSTVFQECIMYPTDYGNVERYIVTVNLAITVESADAQLDLTIDAPKEIYLDFGHFDDAYGFSYIYASYSPPYDKWTIYKVTANVVNGKNVAVWKIDTRQGYAGINGYGIVHRHIADVEDVVAWSIDINPYEHENTVYAHNYFINVEAFQDIRVKAEIDTVEIEVVK